MATMSQVETKHFNAVHPNVLPIVTQIGSAEFLISDMVLSPIPKESRINVLANHLGVDKESIESIKIHLKTIAKLI